MEMNFLSVLSFHFTSSMPIKKRNEYSSLIPNPPTNKDSQEG